MVVNEIYLDLHAQSLYRQHHSTETAFLKVMSDVLLKMNSQHVILMVLLDQGATFDTVDHNMEFKQRRFERRTSTGSRLFVPFGRDLEQLLGQIISIRVKTPSNTNLVASRHIKREKKLTSD